jgi:hypothetical protein
MVLLEDVLGALGIPLNPGANYRVVPEDQIGEDWAGRPAVPVDVARRIVSERRAAEEQRQREEAWARAEAEDAELAEAERLQAVWMRAYNEFVAANPEYDSYAAGEPIGPRRRTPTGRVDRAARQYANQKRREAMGVPA